MEDLLKETRKELKLPVPVNRGILVKNPVDPDDIKIILSEEQQREAARKKLEEQFPDNTIKYEVVAIADTVTIPVKVGDRITTNLNATHRMQHILNSKYIGFTEGDVAFVWPLENE